LTAIRRARKVRFRDEQGEKVMAVADQIRAKLTGALQPSRLEITDDSHLHAGHAGAREGGESHFTVEVVSASFEGLGRVARQRLVYDILKEEMAGPVHALALRTVAPSEETA
jgi:BolA protein